MAESLFANVLLPVASEEDAVATARAAKPYVGDGQVTLVYVVEKAGGAVDKASVQQREENAEAMFAAARAAFGPDVDVTTEVTYGTDVADAIFAVADEVGASAVAFRGRESGFLGRLLTGNVARSLITENDRPVIALPKADE